MEGSITTSCERETGQCYCQNGWEGQRCEINKGMQLPLFHSTVQNKWTD